MAPPRPLDPWGQVDDLEGNALYRVLDLEPSAGSADIKKAYRQLAKQHHPDKGGDPASFARLQAAFEVLADPLRRKVYDTWAKELQFRYVRSGTSSGVGGLGGEDVLLDEFENLGLHCDPATQLVVTCEVCRRPATKECWTCGMQICEFCTLKRHWKDSFPLHWPLINKDHMVEKLGRAQLERKKVDDAQQLQLQDPNHRSERELQDIRTFKEAAQQVLQNPERRTTYDLRLARFYMWAQTAATAFVACHVPTGYEDRELVVECSASGLLVQSEDSPPLIDRILAYRMDSSRQIESFRTQDNRVVVLALPKAEYGEHWQRLFAGDSDGARCMVAPYSLSETAEDVLVEVELPFWIDPEDVSVQFGPQHLQVSVRNTLQLRRTYWRNSGDEDRRSDYSVVQVEECLWSLEEDMNAAGERCKLLMLTVARPAASEEEVKWKRGVRQDNRVTARHGSHFDKGFRFFADDEDDYELEDVLQAVCVIEAGATYVPPKPWRREEEGHWAADVRLLSPAVQQYVATFRKYMADEEAGGGPAAEDGRAA